MPNDNQTAQSYIATVLARADAATPGGSDGGWLARYGGGSPDPTQYYATKVRHMEIRRDGDNYGDDIIAANGTYVLMSENDADFIAASRQDIPTLGKIALRAIAALKEVLPWLERETPPQYVGVDREGLPVEYEPTAAEEACGMAAMVLGAALADINALAAKGSQ